MRYLGQDFDASQTDTLLPLAITGALVTAAIELPISQFYGTTPKTTTGARMAIAGGMAFVAILTAGALIKMTRA
jgi:hypothetical protein